jgi:hypothetical protein
MGQRGKRRYSMKLFNRVAPVAILSLLLVTVASPACGDDDDKATPTAVRTALAASAAATEAKASAATSAPATLTPVPTTSAAAASGLDGMWNGTWRASSTADNGTVRIQWKQTGSQLAGTIAVSNTPCVTNGTITGVVNGNAITFGAVQSATTISYTGTLVGNTITGTYKADASCGNATGTWTATKA